MDLKSPGSLAPALLDRLQRRRSSGVAGRTGRTEVHESGSRSTPLSPSPQTELASLLDVSFFATMLAEEGRPTRFAAAYRSPDSLDGTPARRLERPLPFTPESIRRLAPASDPELTCLGIWPTDGTLCVWGLLDAPRLRCLQIFGTDTGQLRVTCFRQIQMTLRPRRRQRPTRTGSKLPDVHPVDRRGDGPRPAAVVSAAGVVGSRRRPHPGRPWRGHPRVQAAARRGQASSDQPDVSESWPTDDA